jgi:hypothetical protein
MNPDAGPNLKAAPLLGYLQSTSALIMPISPESSSAVPGSPESLPTLEEMLRLPNREVTVVEEEDLGLAGLFWLSKS